MPRRPVLDYRPTQRPPVSARDVLVTVMSLFAIIAAGAMALALILWIVVQFVPTAGI